MQCWYHNWSSAALLFHGAHMVRNRLNWPSAVHMQISEIKRGMHENGFGPKAEIPPCHSLQIRPASGAGFSYIYIYICIFNRFHWGKPFTFSVHPNMTPGAYRCMRDPNRHRNIRGFKASVSPLIEETMRKPSWTVACWRGSKRT